MNMRSIFAGLMMMLAVGACTGIGDGRVPLGPIGQQIAEAVVDVSLENQDLRVCWLASGAVEVITDLAQRAGVEEAGRALGHIVMLQGVIDKAGLSDSFWVETDTADVALLFAGVLKDLGKTRLSQILLGGPTLSNFLNIAKRTVVLTVKGHAVMRDINRTLDGVEDGTLDKAAAMQACENRMEMNRNTLRALTGGLTLSSTSFFGVAPNLMAEYDFIRPVGWEDVGGDAIGAMDWDMIYPETWVGGGGTGPYAMGEEWIDPKDGDVTFDGWETVRGGSGDVIYPEFVASKPVDGDVIRAKETVMDRLPRRKDPGDGIFLAELGFIYKGDALVDGGSFLAYPIPRLAGGDGPAPA